jgi:nucleoside-diphosphate-sugar epimerase
MRALVTGDRGFVGDHMVEELKRRNWEVYGCDIRDGEDAIEWFARDEWDGYFDLIVHCAYVVGGRATIDGHVKTEKWGRPTTPLAQNLMLDAGMFDWALRTHQGAVLYFSSSSVYPIDRQEYGMAGGLSEDLMDWDYCFMPDADYGWAKLIGERLARTFSQNDGRVHIVRPFSGYGSNQSLDYPFPSIIKRAKEGDLTVWGPEGQTRDWIHIDDVVKGALAVYQEDIREPINLCTGVGTEMGALMLMAFESCRPSYNKIKYTINNVEYDESKPTGVFYRVGDPTKLHEIYKPKISIEEGVREAIGKS